jgi:hypothetical protein
VDCYEFTDALEILTPSIIIAVMKEAVKTSETFLE